MLMSVVVLWLGAAFGRDVLQLVITLHNHFLARENTADDFAFTTFAYAKFHGTLFKVHAVFDIDKMIAECLSNEIIQQNALNMQLLIRIQ